MTPDLQERVARLESRAAINDLVVRYFLAADRDDFATLGDCFTEAAQFSTSGVLTARGREAIIDFVRTARASMGLTVHTPNYVQCTFDSENCAGGLVGAHLELVIGDVAVYGAVRYLDRYARQGGTWRICARDMRTVHLAPWVDTASALASTTPVRWPGTEPGASDFSRPPVQNAAGTEQT